MTASSKCARRPEPPRRRRRTGAATRILIFAAVLLLVTSAALALFCPHCGKPVKEGMRFCPYCGKKLPESEAPKPKPPETQPVTPAPPETQPVTPAPPETQPVKPGPATPFPWPMAPTARAGASFDEQVKQGIDSAVAYLWSTQRPDGTWKPVELWQVRGDKPGRTRIGKIDEKDMIAKILGNYVGDNSNSQYGLLGVWAGAKAHLEVPKQYWQLVMQYWVSSQNPDGGWAYRSRNPGDSYASMTVAGLASLYVCVDNLLVGRFAKCGVNPKVRSIEKGLTWLAGNIEKVALDSTVPDQKGNEKKLAVDTYYLFGVERVALACGYKRFGKLDWYRAGAKRILGVQRGDGSIPAGAWGRLNVGTAYAVLFLARGRNPVVFNKLEFDGDWNNRPNDLAVLTRWLTWNFERTLNWQIVKIADPVDDWHDAPLLYISGAKDPGFTDEHLAKLRRFVDQGGTLFSVTECGGRHFRAKIREAYRKIFPDRKLEPMKSTHELFRVHFKVRVPSFYIVSNGVRALAIHCDYDLPLYWQQQRHRTYRRIFEVAANVAMYVTGKGAFLPRGTRHWPVEPQFTPAATVKLAKLRHAANCDPEPLAHERLARLLGHRHRIRLDVAGPVPIAELAKSGARLATLTGTGTLSLTAGEQDALKAFVAGGGTLVVDAAGGDAAFHASARSLLETMYGRGKLRTLSVESKLFQQEGMEIRTLQYRGASQTLRGKSAPPALRAVLVDGRPGVLFSREDITGALVGCASATCDGYEPDSAFQIMRNIVRMAAK